METPFVIHTDGASRANPGPAAFAYVIERPGEADIEEKGRLRDTTNNIAEYTAMIRALDHAARLGGKRVVLRSDSELMVQQMSGKYKVKNEGLIPLFQIARKLVSKFESVKFEHVRREQNKRTDRLCNEALDDRAPMFPLPGEDAGAAKAESGTPKTTSDATTPAVVNESPKEPSKATADGRRERALGYLKDAVRSWVDEGDENDPSPGAVLDRLWAIFAEKES